MKTVICNLFILLVYFVAGQLVVQTPDVSNFVLVQNMGT